MTQIKELKHYKPIQDIFPLFHQEEDAVFLESSLKNHLGQFSIIGRKPYLKLVKDKVFTINGRISDIPFEGFIKEYFARNFKENKSGLPIISGAIGYFSYDYDRKKNNQIPESILIFYDEFIIENHETNSVYLVANGETKNPKEALDELEEIIMNRRETNTSIGAEYQKPDIKYNFKKEEYLKAIEKMMEYIVEGDIYIANMTQQLFLKSGKTPYELYRILSKDNPSPFAAYLNYKNFQVVSASPERFIQVKDRRIVTRPIKGTRKRGKTPEEDWLLKQELENSEKDKSELLMIVDLERNDLNKISKPGSVKVNDLFHIETYATVHHLVATVSGILKENTDIMDIIKATFPGGSITGAPKIRAMEIIEELENNQRGLYTGSIGYFSLNGDCDMNIAIRTAIHQEGIYNLGVGGGITCESQIISEYEETLQKAKAFLDALS
ncbi:aminodeoxychorismate synthase subunit I [Mobilisporobacter senegalensis]|uniref:Anthranilate synthase component 1 n=1 Tax=Mobilisporobacter senegalensis TaxID=1329262 RepID=A0A3N1XL29_9FIRM|nr:aminodeoxychorismate synthase component I [Mobilisporobacter senegalensis]ROR27423.1 aminodeoxychorismate synthase subunit I [Mobilisporobacter senegalensis]